MMLRMARRSLAAALITGFAAAILASVPANSQTAATVSVDTTSSLGTIPATGFGVNTAVWDSYLTDTPVVGLLSQAGITTLRYPGGSTSDDYHWATHSQTDGTQWNPSTDFDNFITKVAQPLGATPIITVNYGSNPAGTGGGDPNEAAGWVDYANNTKHYGVKYWEIGNELYGNGFYGVDWEEDLHYTGSSGRQGNSLLGPAAYGKNVVTFINAMKAKDSSIKIGAVLAAPNNWPEGVNPDWNVNVLQQCGEVIDFVIVHWYPQNPGSENDSYLLSTPSQIAAMVAGVRSQINLYCGTNAPNVQIFTTETNSVSSNPGKQSTSLVNAMYLDDNLPTWLENGVVNVDWWALHNGATDGNDDNSLYGNYDFGDYGILSNGSGSEPPVETQFPAYFGLQMLTHLGQPGDKMVGSASDNPLVAVHAVKQANGNLAVLLINKDRTNACQATVNVYGYAPANSANYYLYGESSSAVQLESTSGLGSSFNVDLSPYSITTLNLTSTGHKLPPTFTSSGTATPTVIAPAAKTTLKTKLTDTGPTCDGKTVEIGVFDAANNLVGSRLFLNQSFGTGQTRAFSYDWTAVATPGNYAMRTGVFDSTLTQQFHWNSNVASITVFGPDTSRYNFETSTQGWVSTGGMISKVAISKDQSFAGAKSLAATFSGASADTQIISTPHPKAGPGTTVTFHVWLPTGSSLTAIQVFVQQTAAGKYTWTGNYQPISSLNQGQWNTLTVQVPNKAAPLHSLGVQFFTNAAWSGKCYVDAVSW